MSEFEKAVTGLGEECGVFGAYDVDGHDVAASVYYGLFALQHSRRNTCRECNATCYKLCKGNTCDCT